MKVKVLWDTDGASLEDCGLKSVVEIPNYVLGEDIADYLSDEYGFCVFDYDFIHEDTPKEYSISPNGEIMQKFCEIFNEYETDTMCISDWDIRINGELIEYIHLNEYGCVELWSGNPDTDKYADEFVNIWKEKYEEILEYFD